MLSPIRTFFMYYPEQAITYAVLLIISDFLLFRHLKMQMRSGYMQKNAAVIRFVTANYLFFLLFFTVLGRRSQDYYTFNFTVGESFLEAVRDTDTHMLFLIAANIMVFVPVGVLLYLLRRSASWAILCAMAISFTVEFLQLALRRGNCETDDLINNTLGAAFGILTAVVIARFRKRRQRDAAKYGQKCSDNEWNSKDNSRRD